jgi:large subunit ribosomal protein L31
MRDQLPSDPKALRTPFSPKSRQSRATALTTLARLRRPAARVIGAPTERAAGPPDGSLLISPETSTMKSDIHPNYHMIKVVMTNGAEFMTRSTYGEEGATLHLDIDPNTHPAWTGGSQQLVDRGGRLSRFNTRFGGLGIGGKK